MAYGTWEPRVRMLEEPAYRDEWMEQKKVMKSGKCGKHGIARLIRRKVNGPRIPRSRI